LKNGRTRLRTLKVKKAELFKGRRRKYYDASRRKAILSCYHTHRKW
jgi:hypothetical protein